MHIPYSTPYITTAAIAAITAAAALSGCSHTPRQDNGATSAAETADDEWLTTEAFVTPAGMTAEQASQLPGLTWELDTLRGVCTTDTLLILACYNERLHPTNLRSLKGKPFEGLKTSGNDKITKGQVANLQIADFKPSAKIAEMTADSYEAYKAQHDSVYRAKIEAMADAAKKFFLTGGDVKYMRRTLAMAWERERAEAEDYGERANPFNGGAYAQFVPSSLKAEVADATRGIVEIEVYSSDSYTLGYPGITYWTVAMCKEQNEYKLKELPALHRKF